MKKLLKISLFLMLVGISIIIFFYLCEGQVFFETAKSIVVSQYESGIYSEEDIKRMKIDEKISEDIKTVAVRAKYVDMEVSKGIDEMHIEYYNLPNVKREIGEDANRSFTATFIDSNYELVFNKNIDKYKRVKIVVPEDKKFEFLLAVGQEVKITSLNVENMNTLIYGLTNSRADISNITVDKLTLMNTASNNISVKDSKIEELKIQSPQKGTFLLTNISGKSLEFGDKNSTITGFGNNKVTLNNVSFTTQGYYSSNFEIDLNNNIPLPSYYFNLTTNDGKIKVNGNEYDKNYESGNFGNSLNKIYIKSNDANIKIN